jgi:hypothetical protein
LVQDYRYHANWAEEELAEVEIDYVGETCRRCGGLGHYARECLTQKGKGKDGKGGKDGGKGYKGHGGYKGYGKDGGYKGSKGYNKDGGYKGKGKGELGGKGFGGPCWVCNEVGHRAAYCPKRALSAGGGNNMEIGAVAEGSAATVGGVWEIAAVEAEEWKVVGKPVRRDPLLMPAGTTKMGKREVEVDGKVGIKKASARRTSTCGTCLRPSTAAMSNLKKC